MDSMMYWIFWSFCLLVIYQGVIVCEEAQGHRLNSNGKFMTSYSDVQTQFLPQPRSLWYKNLHSWGNPSRQEELMQHLYRREPVYHLDRKQLRQNNEEALLSNNAQPNLKSPYIPVRDIEINGREGDPMEKSDKPNGHITVQVYKSSPIKEVEDEENLDDQSGEKSTVIASHSVQNIRQNLKKEEKKSPQPVQQTESLSLASKSNDSPTFDSQKQPPVKEDESKSFSDVYFVAIVAGCSAVAIFGVVAAGFCFYKFQKSSKAAAEVDYPAYGVTGPSKETISPNGDRKLAQSAQMYHYQHQKQQMIAVEKASSAHHASTSDVDSEEENEEGHYIVYECPGLASTGEMEVKNPLFNDDSTPISPPIVTPKPPEK